MIEFARQEMLDRIAAHAKATELLVREVSEFVISSAEQSRANNDMSEIMAHSKAEPNIWFTVGKTKMQTGLMALKRAVEQPTDF